MSILGNEGIGDVESSGSESGYVAQLGRISGKLLRENLTRNGVDLAFDTNLLYLKVAPLKIGTDPNEDGDPNYGKLGYNTGFLTGIGINTDAPQFDLDVNGHTRVSNNVRVADLDSTGVKAEISNVVFNADGTVTSVMGPIELVPTGSNSYIRHNRVTNDQLLIQGNLIKVTEVDQGLSLVPNSSGRVDIIASSRVQGDVNVSGAIRTNKDMIVGGYVTVGDSPLDTVTIVPDFSQSIVPGATDLYSLGTPSLKWAELHLSDTSGTVNKFITSATVSSQIGLFGHTISTLQSSDDLILTSDSGNVTLEKINFNENTITNLLDSPLVFHSTARGFVKFDDTTALVVPAGTTAERGYTEVGETRWNTDEQYLECFDGTTYQVATGGGRVVTADIMTELGNLYALILG